MWKLQPQNVTKSNCYKIKPSSSLVYLGHIICSWTAGPKQSLKCWLTYLLVFISWEQLDTVIMLLNQDIILGYYKYFKNSGLTLPYCVCLCIFFPGEVYVSDKTGSDQDGDGTEQKPFKTPLKVNDHFALMLFCSITVQVFTFQDLMFRGEKKQKSYQYLLNWLILATSQCTMSNQSLQALMFAGKEPFPTIYVDSQKEGEVGSECPFFLFLNSHIHFFPYQLLYPH